MGDVYFVGRGPKTDFASLADESAVRSRRGRGRLRLRFAQASLCSDFALLRFRFAQISLCSGFALLRFRLRLRLARASLAGESAVSVAL